MVYYKTVENNDKNNVSIDAVCALDVYNMTHEKKNSRIAKYASGAGKIYYC